MNWLYLTLIGVTVLQTLVCGFTLPLILSYIGRLLFLARLLGTVIPWKVSLGFEVGHLFFVLLDIVFNAGKADWFHILFSTLFIGIAALLYWLDTEYYLYIVEDDPDDDTDKN